MISYGCDFHPHELSIGMLKMYEKIPEKDKPKLAELAQKFYDELGCNREGRVGHSKFESIENLCK